MNIGRYEIVQDEDDGSWEVIVYYDHGFEAWGYFDSEAQALASVAEHKSKKTTH